MVVAVVVVVVVVVGVNIVSRIVSIVYSGRGGSSRSW